MVVANKVQRARTMKNLSVQKIPAEDLLGFIHYNSEVIDADRQGTVPIRFQRRTDTGSTQH